MLKQKLTNDKCIHLHRVITIHIMKFFHTHLETFSCNFLLNQEAEKTYQQRLQNIATFMYKVKNRLVPTYITEIFNTKLIQYNLRNADFNIPRFRTVRYGKHS